jgi:hypothetical protein
MDARFLLKDFARSLNSGNREVLEQEPRPSIVPQSSPRWEGFDFGIQTIDDDRQDDENRLVFVIKR